MLKDRHILNCNVFHLSLSLKFKQSISLHTFLVKPQFCLLIVKVASVKEVTEHTYPSNSNTCFYKYYFCIETDYLKWYSNSSLTSDLFCRELGFQFLRIKSEMIVKLEKMNLKKYSERFFSVTYSVISLMCVALSQSYSTIFYKLTAILCFHEQSVFEANL